MTTATARRALDRSELLALLNWELAAYSECDGCRFTGIRPMRKHGDSDCNWADARVDSDHWLTVDEQLIVRQGIEDTRREFDLRPH
jgi:hypothetical protein